MHKYARKDTNWELGWRMDDEQGGNGAAAERNINTFKHKTTIVWNRIRWQLIRCFYVERKVFRSSTVTAVEQV